MAVVIKDIKQDGFISEWPNKRVSHPVVKYSMRDTEIHFQHSNIVEKLREALVLLFTPDELEKDATRRSSARLALRPVFTETYYHHEKLVIRYTKVQLPNTIEHSICFHLMENGWKNTGYHMLKFRGLFQKIAKAEGWERGVYFDNDIPTKNPIFTITSSAEEIIVTAPFGEISEEKFLRIFRLGQSTKPRKNVSKY